MLKFPQLPANPNSQVLGAAKLSGARGSSASSGKADALKDTFQQFVGETFFQMMLKSMRETHDKPAYMHGGQAEEIFQGQLDQEVAGNLAHASGGSFSNDLFQLFRLQLEHPPLNTHPRVETETSKAGESVVDPVRELLKS